MNTNLPTHAVIVERNYVMTGETTARFLTTAKVIPFTRDVLSYRNGDPTFDGRVILCSDQASANRVAKENRFRGREFVAAAA